MNETNQNVYVIDGESYERTVTIDHDVVTRHHVTAHKSGKCPMIWNFDFTDVPHDAILELASRAVLIGERPTFKNCAVRNIPEWNGKTFRVADFIARERGKTSKADKITSLFAGLNDDEKADLLAQLS